MDLDRLEWVVKLGLPGAFLLFAAVGYLWLGPRRNKRQYARLVAALGGELNPWSGSWTFQHQGKRMVLRQISSGRGGSLPELWCAAESSHRFFVGPAEIMRYIFWRGPRRTVYQEGRAFLVGADDERFLAMLEERVPTVDGLDLLFEREWGCLKVAPSWRLDGFGFRRVWSACYGGFSGEIYARPELFREYLDRAMKLLESLGVR